MRKLVYISNWLYLFSLSLWVGGMFLLGILVEIMVRVNLKEQPLVASKIMKGIMDVFNVHIIYTCIALIVIAEGVKFLVQKYGSTGIVSPRVTKRRYTKEVFLGIMIVLALYMGSVMRPQMHAVDKEKKANPENKQLQIQFNRFHQRLELLYTVNMILGLSCFYINGKEMTRFRED